MSTRAKSLLLFLFLALSAAAVWRLAGGAGAPVVRAGDGASVARPARAAGGLPAAGAAGGERGAAARAADGERVSIETSAPLPAAALEPAFAEGFDPAALYGTLQDQKARPLGGARVLLFQDGVPVDEAGPALAECRSDAAGRFRFAALEPYAEYRVYADASGFLPALSTRRTGVDEKLELARAAPFAGRVTDAASGAPLPGVELAVSLVTAPGLELVSPCSATTDAEGRYFLPFGGLERAQRVDVRRPGALWEAREFQVRADRPDGYDIELGQGEALALRFFELDTGRPVAGRELKVSGIAVTTDERGLARLQAPGTAPGEDGLVLDVRVTGWCRTNRTLTLPAGGEVEVPLLRGATVRGVVTAEGGAPLPGAFVALSGRNRLTGYELPPRTTLRAEGKRVKTDAEGRFELTGILPGEQALRVSAWHDDYPPERSESFLLLTPAAVKEVALELVPGARLAGTVTLNGEPVLARVSWQNGDADGRGAANDSGAYLIRGVAPGEVHLGAQVDDGSWRDDQHEETVWVEAGVETHHDVKLAMSRASIRGLVQDTLGAPVPGIAVTCFAEVEEGEDWRFTRVEADAEGRFELKVDDRPGVLFTVTASDGGRRAQRTGLAVGAENVDLVLPLAGKLRLEVVDAATRERLEAFNLYWRPRDGGGPFQTLSNGRTVAPGADGVFEAELPVGAHDLRITAREKGYAPREVLNVSVSEAGGGAPEQVELELGVTLELRVVPVDPSAKLSQVTLVTQEQEAELQASGWSAYSNYEIQGGQRAQVGPDGRVVLKALAPGRYSFYRAPQGSVFDPAVIEVPPVDVHRAEVRWRVEPGPAGKEPALQGLGYL